MPVLVGVFAIDVALIDGHLLLAWDTIELLGRDDIGANLLCWHEALQCEQLLFLRMVPIGCCVRCLQFDRLYCIALVGHDHHLLRLECLLWLRPFAMLFSDAHQHCKLSLEIHVIQRLVCISGTLSLLLGHRCLLLGARRHLFIGCDDRRLLAV